MNPIEISIILISHNRYPQNLFTLYSLCNQKFDLSKVEVILIDDASTDKTPILEHFKAPFHFKYVRCTTNVGRSKAKNIGIELAQGKIIIFQDVEVLVDPSFIKKHYKHHQNEEQLVVCANNGRYGAYTLLDPKLSDQQFKHFYSIIRYHPKVLRRFNLHYSITDANIRKLRQLLINRKKPIPLVSKRDIYLKFYRKLAFPDPIYKKITDLYGEDLKGFHFPWIFCITRNISLRKELLDLVGNFSEEFVGWGSEDNELGYRLYKAGAKFIDDATIRTYHQEHPYSQEERFRDMLTNYRLFQQKHPDMEIYFMSLPLCGIADYIEANQILEQYRSLSDEFPDQFEDFKENLKKLLLGITNLSLSEKVTIDVDPSIAEEMQQLSKLKPYSKLIKLYHVLLKKLKTEVSP